MATVESSTIWAPLLEERSRAASLALTAGADARASPIPAADKMNIKAPAENASRYPEFGAFIYPRRIGPESARVNRSRLPARSNSHAKTPKSTRI